ncbi:MAG TPA: prepilin peptidase [Amycolatopsis sp.]|uniref:prepilin peptidase n=1 Tax=Amycolatopsis sp. TaxID=37632 RepID=UPI002F42F733
MIAVAAAVLGLLVGSFLNVVVHRVPRGESVVRPPSRCPGCGAGIRARHNVPVLGWLLLRGRCAGCGGRISVRYPLVELGTAGLFAVLALRLPLPDLPAFLYLAAAGLALALIDVDTRRLPNALVLPAYPVLAVLLTASAWWQGDWWSLARAVVGGAALFGGYLLLAVVYPAGMGFGDVRLAGVLGGILAYLSWSALVIGAFAAFLLGAVAGVAVLASGGGRKTALPFGPFMLGGALLAVFAAGPLGTAYGELAGAIAR